MPDLGCGIFRDTREASTPLLVHAYRYNPPCYKSQGLFGEEEFESEIEEANPRDDHHEEQDGNATDDRTE